MKSQLSYLVAGLLLLSSCGTYTGSGAYTGSTLGSILGSAIGGLAGGPHGSDVGTIVGMVGGATLGAAIGSQADKARTEGVVQPRAERYTPPSPRRTAATSGNSGVYRQPLATEMPADSLSARMPGAPDYSGYDPTGSGDDRLYDFTGSDYTGDYSAGRPVTTVPATSSVEDLAGAYAFAPSIEIRNARFVDANHDNAINRGEVCKVIFEVYNRGQQTLYDVVPTVVEASSNRHILISPSIHVERIDPGHGIRYTAMVQADSRLKEGKARICVSVLQGDKAVSQVTEFDIPTRK